jgi:hypothetical protein
MSSLILWIFYFIGLFVFFPTGELLLYVVTFGKYRARNAITRSDNEGHFALGQLYFSSSCYVGIAFWIVVLITIKKYLF